MVLHWETALDAAEDYVFAGSSNWRLPNFKELASIIEKSCYAPAINEHTFPATLSIDYLSSSPSIGMNNFGAWNVNFEVGYGFFDARSDPNYRIRLVGAGD